jgi:excisionase family DNA binding protein
MMASGPVGQGALQATCSARGHLRAARLIEEFADMNTKYFFPSPSFRQPSSSTPAAVVDQATAPGPDPTPPAPRTAGSGRPGMEYWRVDRVARFLDISKKRVYQLVQEKRLSAIRLGPRQMRIARQSLDSYLDELARRQAEEEY